MYLFFVSIVIIFSTINRMKNRPLTIIEPQAHKNAWLALVISIIAILVMNHGKVTWLQIMVSL